MPQFTVQPWGGIEVTVILVADPAYAVVAEFAPDVTWSAPMLDAGRWSDEAGGRIKGTFQYYPSGGAAFIRFRSYRSGGW
jgi:hypothetical protein